MHHVKSCSIGVKLMHMKCHQSSVSGPMYVNSLAQSKQGIFPSTLHYEVSEYFVLLEYAQGFSKTVTVLLLKYYTPQGTCN